MMECPGAEQRTWVGRRERWEAPVEDGGHVAGTAEVASGGGCQQVAEWMLSGLRRQHFAGDHTSASAGSPGAYTEARRVADLIRSALSARSHYRPG